MNEEVRQAGPTAGRKEGARKGTGNGERNPAREGRRDQAADRDDRADRADEAAGRAVKEEAGRPHDVVLFGATGFVGALTAEYLAANAPADCRWALAARDLGKLERLRDRLAALHPAAADVPLIRADASDPAAVRELAAATRVLATTVGPYVLYGGEIVAGCAASGTDYVDLTGEPEFVDRTYVLHDAQARETGARLVHACGFDSIPADLGTYFTVAQLPRDVPIRVDGFMRSNALFSGGTLASALTAMGRAPQTLAAARERRLHEHRLPGRRIRGPLGVPRFSRETGTWGLPLPTLDPRIVTRSAAALDRYGPDFRYRHYASVKHLPFALGGTAAVGATAALAQLPPARQWLMDRWEPGRGPDAERRARSWFTVRFVGEGGGRRVLTEVSGGDPGYGETAKMLAESALCLAYDALPQRAGQLTTAVAMGDSLLDRLQKAGIRFRVASAR
ncbi:saccharopine dehydrogenase NADP-binding domain-containing protein [Streptomyces sp. KD18]|nr:saccharopine dehydrogenase NADP-binding domain-containing protein [Streptomyces sp. KD18]